jgi:hypothetical protein
LTNTQIDNALNFLAAFPDQFRAPATRSSSCRRSIGTSTTRTRFTVSYNRLRWDSPAGVQTQATNTRAIDNFGDDFVEIDALNAKTGFDAHADAAERVSLSSGAATTSFSSASRRSPASRPTPSVAGRRRQFSSAPRLSHSVCPSFSSALRSRMSALAVCRHDHDDAGNHTFKFGGDINFVKDIINNLRFSVVSSTTRARQPESARLHRRLR